MIEQHEQLQLRRSVVLGTLAGLTFAFLLGAAAFAYWHDVDQIAADKVAPKSQLSTAEDTDIVLRPTVYEASLPSVTGGQIQNAAFAANDPRTTAVTLEYKAAPVPDLVQAGREQDKTGFCIFSNRTLETPERYMLTHGQQDATAAGDPAPLTTVRQP